MGKDKSKGKMMTALYYRMRLSDAVGKKRFIVLVIFCYIALC